MRKPPRLFRAEQVYSRYCHIAEDDVEIADVIDGSYWCNVAKELKRGDVMEVRRSDGAWEVELRVTHADRLKPRVEIRGVWEREEPAPVAEPGDDSADYEIKHHSRKGWRVIDKASGSILIENLGTSDEARMWAEARDRRLAA